MNLLPGLPPLESPCFSQWVTTLPDWVQPIARSLHESGYAVLDFPDPRFASWAKQIRQDLTPHFDLQAWRHRRQAGHPGGLRIRDAVDLSDSVRQLAGAPKLLELLEWLYGRTPFPFQTLNFPVGTEQGMHSDTVHFHSWPERFLCGVWVALEDLHEEGGPLLYWPGSHRFPCLTNELVGQPPQGATNQDAFTPAWIQLVQQHGLQSKRFVARKGQTLIWVANLLHGGAPHTAIEHTRWSQVTHYYFEGCAYWTPLFSDVISGQIHFREPQNLLTGQSVPNCSLGNPLPAWHVKLSHFRTPKLAPIPRLRRWWARHQHRVQGVM